MTTSLIRRGSVYYFRARVPDDLALRLGRRELKVSLRTTDGRIARAQVARFRARAYDLFERLRCDPMLTDDEIIYLAQWFYREKVAENHHWRGMADHEPRLQEAHEAKIAERPGLEEEIRRDLRAGRPGLVWTDAEMLMHDLGRPEEVDENSVQFRKLCHFMLRGLLEATRRAREEDDCVFGGEPTDPVFKGLDDAGVPAIPAAPVAVSPPAAAAPAPANPNRQVLGLREVLDLWQAENKPRERTASDFATQIRRFIEVNGDVPVANITASHVRAFKDAMLRFPAVVKAQDRGLTVPDLVAKAKAANAACLSPRTVKDKALGALSAVLGYAAASDLRDGNPAAQMKVGGTVRHEPTRLPFTLGELLRIFSSPVFSRGERPLGGAGEAAKWLPVLALLTGARLEELGRLRVCDVAIEQGVHYLFIRRVTGGKDVKTGQSRRKVPIHPELERFGFLAYVEERRAAGADAPLFPALKSQRGEITAAFSQWWGRYMKEIGLDDSRKVFHSFRHTVKRELRNAAVEKTLRDALMGHAHKDVAEEYGVDEEGSGVALPALYRAMCRLEYPEELVRVLTNMKR
jgi:integrase